MMKILIILNDWLTKSDGLIIRDMTIKCHPSLKVCVKVVEFLSIYLNISPCSFTIEVMV